MEFSMPLPIELVLEVMTCLLPANPREILSPFHITTVTLLNFTRVCRVTRKLANKYLRDHCMYICSSARLASLLRCIENGRTDLCEMQNLYLAPFVDTIDDQPTALWVRELFFYTRSSLRRLTVDMPMRSISNHTDHLECQRFLRDGFQALEQLEEFVSVRDELYVGKGWLESPVFVWPKLRKLALYNANLDTQFWRQVASEKTSDLATLILTRADSLGDCNIKTSFFQPPPDQRHPKLGNRDLKVVLVNVQNHQPSNMPRERWKEVDPDNRIRIMFYHVPTSFYGDDDEIELCQEEVKRAALKGTLWDWEGPSAENL